MSSLGFSRRPASCLGLDHPTGNGGLAVVTGFELQGDGAGPDVGDGQVGWRTGQFWRRTEENKGYKDSEKDYNQVRCSV